SSSRITSGLLLVDLADEGGIGGGEGGGWSPSTGGRGRPGHDVDWTWFQTALMASQITSASVQRASGMATEHECAISMTLVGAKDAIAITAQPNMTHLRPTSPRMPGTIGPKNISASQKKNAAHGPQDSMFTSNLLLHWGSAPAPIGGGGDVGAGGAAGGAAESAPRRGARCALLGHPEESSGRWCSVLPHILAHLAQLAQVAFVIWCTSARCVSLCRMRRVTVTQLRADKPGQSDHSFS